MSDQSLSFGLSNGSRRRWADLGPSVNIRPFVRFDDHAFIGLLLALEVDSIFSRGQRDGKAVGQHVAGNFTHILACLGIDDVPARPGWISCWRISKNRRTPHDALNPRIRDRTILRLRRSRGQQTPGDKR